jgi:hypothetical protein
LRRPEDALALGQKIVEQARNGKDKGRASATKRHLPRRYETIATRMIERRMGSLNPDTLCETGLKEFNEQRF